MQPKIIKIIIIFLVLSLVICIFLWVKSRKPPTPEEQIARLLIDAQNAFNEGDSTRLLKYVSQDYDDGSYTRRELVPLVFKAVKVENILRVTVMQPIILVEENTAAATVPVHVERQTSQAMDTGANDSYDLEVQLRMRQQGQRWQVIRATGWDITSHQNR